MRIEQQNFIIFMYLKSKNDLEYAVIVIWDSVYVMILDIECHSIPLLGFRNSTLVLTGDITFSCFL